MEIIRIKSTEDFYFNRIWEIYQYSFPRYEQRTFEHQQTAFRSDRYHMDCYVEEGRVVGFIGYWVFDTYSYIEHYAMAKENRGSGYGSRILKEFLDKTDNIVVLEIDPIIDEVSQRRLRFYQHLGFVDNPFEHQCPTYQPDAVEGYLLILTYPEAVDCEFYDRFYHDLHTVVMARD